MEKKKIKTPLIPSRAFCPQHALDAKRANSLIHDCEYSVIADALKQYFRFMEEPLLQSTLFNDWMRAMQQ